MTLREIVTQLNAHLKRLEREQLALGWRQAGAYYMGGARIRLTYISRNGGTTISRSKAVAYLDWLNAGGVGEHTARVLPNEHASTRKLDG